MQKNAEFCVNYFKLPTLNFQSIRSENFENLEYLSDFMD